MNYEELIGTRDARKTNKIRLPYGYFYKRLIDGKYSNFVEFHDELSDSIIFGDCIRREHDALGRISDNCQLHYSPNEGDDGVYAIAVESGNYITFEQLLNDTPSIVAKKDFIDSTIHDLVALTSALNGEGLRHVCFAPSSLLVRKSDGAVRLLCHGSSFYRLHMEDMMYEGLEEYIAPEVLDGVEPTDRSDVYSLAKFIDYLYASSGMPLELKKVITKAVSEDPQARYASVDEMYKAMKTRRSLRRTAVMGIGALLIALLLAGLYFDLLPNREPTEFVKPVEEPMGDDLLDDGFNPITELGPDADSATISRAIQDYMLNDSGRIDQRKLREFEAKAEQIFRKQYTKAADAILSKIYNNERMNISEKTFIASSEEVMKELVEKQVELTQNSILSDEKAQRIASEIIEQLTEKKKAEMASKPNYGFQKGDTNKETNSNNNTENKK